MEVKRRQRRRTRCPQYIRHAYVWMVIVLCAIWCAADQLHAEENAGAATDTPWQINADKIEYNQDQGTYVAEGNVVVTRKGKSISADQVQLDQKTQEALAIGNVRLVSENDMLSGQRLRLNLGSETGEVTNGSLFIKANHLYLSGDLIRKTGPQTYAADRFTLTACDGPHPDWKVTGKDLNVTIEGYGFAKHTALWAGKIPLLYSPFLVFPVKLKRQSGLLIPEFGYSQRKGSQYLQPFFWAINDHSDATVYAHYMSERGVRTGIEYRYILSEHSKGAIIAEGFTDDQVDDGSTESSETWGYQDDTADRPNRDRYWFRMKHDQDLFAGLTGKLDLDVVSDQDYLHEFKDGTNGFLATQDYFLNTFGRDIDDEIDPIRLNRLNFNRRWDHFTFNTDLRWYDDVIKRRQEIADDTLQQIPAIGINATQQPVAGSPIYYDLSSSYVYYYRINGTSSQRLDLYPRLYLPLQLFQSITVAPSVGARATAWYPSQNDDQPEEEQEQYYRYLYDFKLDTQTEFFRLFNFSMAGSDQLRHAVTPQIVYEYIPEQDQSDLPEIDDVDRIEAKNLVTYSLTNTLTARMPEQNSNEQTNFHYQTFLRFKLEQSFDFSRQDDEDPEPFSDIFAELDITPRRYVSLNANARWSIYDDALRSFGSTLGLRDNRGDKLSINYNYNSDSSPSSDDGSESIGLEAELKISGRLKVRGKHERNIYDQIDIESSFGIHFQSQCWGVDISYAIEAQDQRYRIMLNLLSLGSMGYNP